MPVEENSSIDAFLLQVSSSLCLSGLRSCPRTSAELGGEYSAEPICAADSTKGKKSSLKNFTLWLEMSSQSGPYVQVLGERVNFAS